MKPSKLHLFASVSLFCLLGVGCTDAGQLELQKNLYRWAQKLGLPVERILPQWSKKMSPSSDPSGTVAESGDGSGGAQQRWEASQKANAEIIQELYRVVWLKDPEDREEFAGWVAALSGGASIEGVYNGFTHSDRYRTLETTQRGATVRALKVFAIELTELTLHLSQPTLFESSAADPLPKAVEPDGYFEPSSVQFGRAAQKAGHSSGDATAHSDSKPGRTELHKRYSQTFVGSSIFTLKRILGDELLKVVQAKEADRERLSDWYAKWAVHMASYQVSFGLERRNSTDEGAHYRWALEASVDRIRWECLNRLHRLLNSAQGQEN